MVAEKPHGAKFPYWGGGGGVLIFTVYFPLSFSSYVIFSYTMTKTKLLFIRTQGCTYH